MVTVILRSEIIDSGRRVVEQLDSDGIKVDAAFWCFMEEKDAWKLMLSLPELTSEGTRAGYKAVQKSLSRIPDPGITLTDIMVLRPSSPSIALLRAGLIEDAYIYRNLKGR